MRTIILPTVLRQSDDWGLTYLNVFTINTKLGKLVELHRLLLLSVQSMLAQTDTESAVYDHDLHIAKLIVENHCLLKERKRRPVTLVTNVVMH